MCCKNGSENIYVLIGPVVKAASGKSPPTPFWAEYVTLSGLSGDQLVHSLDVNRDRPIHVVD